MQSRVDSVLSHCSRPASRKLSASSTGRGRGRPKKDKSEDNSYSADMNASATVQLGKRSRHSATIKGDLSNYDLNDDASPELTATHIDAATEPSMSIAMKEISMQSVLRLTNLVNYLDDAHP
jgi:hypothetical protein